VKPGRGRQTPTGPNSPTAHARAIKGSRRKALARRIKELEDQLRAAAGETRKNMRERIARLSGELKEMEGKLKGRADQVETIVTQQRELSRLRGLLKEHKIDPDTGGSL